MIRIEFSLAVSIYIVITVCAFLVFWMFFEKNTGAGPFSSDKRFFWQCNICTYVYVDSKHSKISQCPRCRSYNKKEEIAKS